MWNREICFRARVMSVGFKLLMWLNVRVPGGAWLAVLKEGMCRESDFANTFQSYEHKSNRYWAGVMMVRWTAVGTRTRRRIFAPGTLASSLVPAPLDCDEDIRVKRDLGRTEVGTSGVLDLKIEFFSGFDSGSARLRYYLES